MQILQSKNSEDYKTIEKFYEPPEQKIQLIKTIKLKPINILHLLDICNKFCNQNSERKTFLEWWKSENFDDVPNDISLFTDFIEIIENPNYEPFELLSCQLFCKFIKFVCQIFTDQSWRISYMRLLLQVSL